MNGLTWCHSGAMDLGLYVENIHRQLAVAAEAAAWCAAITLACFLWARAAFNRDPAP
jgi:hypothetical protein